MALAAGGGVERDDEHARRNDAGSERGEAPDREPYVGEPQSEEAERREQHEHAAAVGTGGAQPDEREREERDSTEPGDARERARREHRGQQQGRRLVRQPVEAAAPVGLRPDRSERVHFGPEPQDEGISSKEHKQEREQARGRRGPQREERDPDRHRADDEGRPFDVYSAQEQREREPGRGDEDRRAAQERRAEPEGGRRSRGGSLQ